jgi:hypothetical protein
MTRKVLALAAMLASTPVLADPIPVFDHPDALLEAIYAQVEAYQDWETFDFDAAFDEEEAFSARLSDLLDAANQRLYAEGEEMGVLDFSPFINGQDSGGMAFTIHPAKIKGDVAVTSVDITLSGAPLYTIRFNLVNEGASGWKVDDILLPWGDPGETVRLSDFLTDPGMF